MQIYEICAKFARTTISWREVINSRLRLWEDCDTGIQHSYPKYIRRDKKNQFKIRFIQGEFSYVFGSGTAKSTRSHLVRTAPAAAAARVQQILNHVIG